jgi:hypothetical protein
MGRIEGNKPQEVRVAENNKVNGNNNQQVTNNNGNGNNNIAPGGATENLRNQGDLTRYQLEARYNANANGTNNGGEPGKTPKSEEALKTIKTALDDSGFLDDVTHTELRRVEDTLRGLNKAEVNYVLNKMSPEDFKQWGEDLNDGGLFDYRGYDSNEQTRLFNHLAQNASADNLVKMFEGLGTNVDSVMSLMDSVAQSAPPAVRDSFIQKVANHPNMEAVRNEMLLDLGQMGLDIAGIFDPTGAVDGANAAGYLLRGKLGDAFMTGLGVVPLLGDLAKAGKLGKFGARLAGIIELAKHSPEFRKAAEAALKTINDVLKKLPIDNLPGSVKDFVQNTTKKIDDFFASKTPNNTPNNAPGATPSAPGATPPPKLPPTNPKDWNDLGLGQAIERVLKRTDLDAATLKSIDETLSALNEARKNGKLSTDGSLKQLIGELATANPKKVSENLTELEHAAHVLKSANLAAGTKVIIGAKTGQDLPGTGLPKIDVADVEADVYYKTSDGVLHLDETKDTFNALVSKVKETTNAQPGNPKQFGRYSEWIDNGTAAGQTRQVNIFVRNSGPNFDRLLDTTTLNTLQNTVGKDPAQPFLRVGDRSFSINDLRQMQTDAEAKIADYISKNGTANLNQWVKDNFGSVEQAFKTLGKEYGTK